MAERVAEKIRKLRDAEIRKQRRLGRSLAAIALEYGVSRQRIEQIAGATRVVARKPGGGKRP